ncbi:MAG: hypothetical protein KIS66_13745 [Fimbriimonadaceae bacterium]|nr:hypothetical protein [Fimbriimonadaceae bacterium]
MLTPKKARAAVDVAEDLLTDERIAEKHGIGRRTLATWKKEPEFAAEVERARAEMVRTAFETGLAGKEARLVAKHRRWQELQGVVRERARLWRARLAKDADEEDRDPASAGVETGLIVRRLDSIGHGEYSRTVEVYELDKGLLSELATLERDVAKELGQMAPTRTDLTSQGRAIGALMFEGLSDDDLERRLAAAEGREAPAAVPSGP